ncbi:hypothetical protein HYT55_01350 [Candidatus Woesearchaeota archaeon]|nr:hypothetical protein [Candidatus Woesearchaeota archaeon]
MGIERVFNLGGDSCYVIDDVVEERPHQAAAEVVTRFLEENPEGIVWAFYHYFTLPIERAFTRTDALALGGELLPNVIKVRESVSPRSKVLRIAEQFWDAREISFLFASEA